MQHEVHKRRQNFSQILSEAYKRECDFHAFLLYTMVYSKGNSI